MFQVPGLILLPIVFIFPATNNLELLKWGTFIVGMATIAQFSFWGNYLPRVYPTYLRGTDGVHRAFGLAVLTVTGTGIARIVVFGDPGLVTRFGFPPVQ